LVADGRNWRLPWRRLRSCDRNRARRRSRVAALPRPARAALWRSPPPL